MVATVLPKSTDYPSPQGLMPDLGISKKEA